MMTSHASFLSGGIFLQSLLSRANRPAFSTHARVPDGGGRLVALFIVIFLGPGGVAVA